jgi:hypothetical protein
MIIESISRAAAGLAPEDATLGQARHTASLRGEDTVAGPYVRRWLDWRMDRWFAEHARCDRLACEVESAELGLCPDCTLPGGCHEY